MFKKFLKSFSSGGIGVDLGSSTIMMVTAEKGIIVNEPTIVAINTKNGEIVSVGFSAKKMIGKTPPHIIVSKPLSGGIISDFEVAEKLIKYFIDRLSEGRFFSGRPFIIIGVPTGITEVERKAVEDAAFSSGAREVYLVEQSLASAIGARLPIEDPNGNMIVDLGSGLTEIAVISLDGIVVNKKITFAGEKMDLDIVNYVRAKFNLLLGETIAEEIKIKIGGVGDYGDNLEMTARGRDLSSGLPSEIIIATGDINEAISKSFNVIVEDIKSTLEITPPELAADIYQQGIVLTGGLSLLRGLPDYISKSIGIPVIVADDPATTVVRGTAMLLEDKELLKKIANMTGANDEMT